MASTASSVSAPLSPVPFVDLTWQHQPLQAELNQVIQAVIADSAYVLGPTVAAFEQAFAAASGAAYGVGVGCGTDAIALGLTACGIGPGDEVILPANTFVATLIGILRSGATPILVDCDPQTALMDLTAAAAAITPRTRALLPVHLYGQMVSPSRLQALAERHGLIIFEDAAQAHLAEREGCRAGSVGMAAAFSFYPSKNLGALGDGGMILTQGEIVAQTARALRNYGASRKYYHTDPGGTNSRLDGIQAAALGVKLPHLGGWNQQRYALAQRYDQRLAPLADFGLQPLTNHCGQGHVYHLYVVRVMPQCPVNRDLIQLKLNALGIQTGIHYPIPCHLQPAFADLGWGVGSFPQAEALSHEILSLPMYPGLTLAQVDQVTDAIAALVNPAAAPQSDGADTATQAISSPPSSP